MTDDHRHPGAVRTLVLPGAAHTVLAAVIAIPVYWRLFQFWAVYDDEGYLTLSLRNFVDGGTLYHDVFTQYGPAYYEFWGALVSVLGLDVTMNTGRLLVLAVWVLSSLLGGVAVSAFTRNVLVGLAAQIVLFSVLTGLTPEPMHPSGLIVLLLASFAAAATVVVPRWGTAGAALLGAIAATVALTKLNVGIFLLGGTALGLVLALPEGRWRRPAVAAAAVVAAAVPFALMGPDLGDPTVARYAWIAALGLLAVGVTGLLAPQPVAAPALRRFTVVFAVAGAATGAAIVLAIFALGSSPSELWHGVVTEPSKLRDVFSILLQTAPNHLRWAIAGLAAAVVWGLLRRRPAPAAGLVAAGVIRVGIGVLAWMALAQLGPFDLFSSRLVFPLAFAWLAAAPPRSAPGRPELGIPRLVLAASAAFETLQAYPVAGTQVQFGGVLLAVTSGIVIADGIREVRGAVTAKAPVPGLIAVAAGLAVAIGFAVPVLVQPWDETRAVYTAGKPLPFYGANRVHLPESFVTNMDDLVHEVRARCDTVIGQPGFGSLHLWSGVRPPNGLMPGDWILLLNAEQQQRVVDDAKRSGRVCVVRNEDQLNSWASGHTVPRRPLLRYVDTFRTVKTFGPWQLQLPAAQSGGT